MSADPAEHIWSGRMARYQRARVCALAAEQSEAPGDDGSEAVLKYFAYGSNLCSRRLRERTPSEAVVAVARLEGHVLRFHKVGYRDGSGKCNAFATGRPTDHLWGAVFAIDPVEKSCLDRAEGLGVGYEEITVEVNSTSGPMSAFTYVADAEAIMPDLKPYTWYKEFVVTGAAEHDLSPEYVDTIRAVKAVHDPNEARRAAHEQVLYPERAGGRRVR